jgi:hypothetical protein
MKQQQRELVRLTCRITRLESKVYLAMAVMDKDMGKLLNYRQLMNSQIQKSMEPVSSQKIWVTRKWHQRVHKKPTNTIEFISEHEIPADRRKDVT